MRKKAPAAARRRGDGGEAVLRQGFAKHTTEEERCWGGEGCALEGGRGCPPLTPLFIGGREKGAGPLEPI